MLQWLSGCVDFNHLKHVGRLVKTPVYGERSETKLKYTQEGHPVTIVLRFTLNLHKLLMLPYILSFHWHLCKLVHNTMQ